MAGRLIKTTPDCSTAKRSVAKRRNEPRKTAKYEKPEYVQKKKKISKISTLKENRKLTNGFICFIISFVSFSW